MNKLINFTDKQEEKIQAYANKNTNGNFNEAVRRLVNKALDREKNIETYKVGDLVKIIFRSVSSEKASAERMWVEITGVYPDYYEGKLDNDPAVSDCMKLGQIVTFKSCQVIDIYEEKDNYELVEE